MTTATKQGHTPGPWHRNIRREGRYPVVFAGRNQHVATASQQDDPAETEANIDLIAAAPELLEALERLLNQATGPTEIYGDGIGADGKKTGLSHWEFNALRDERIAFARAAIARATGQGGGE